MGLDGVAVRRGKQWGLGGTLRHQWALAGQWSVWEGGGVGGHCGPVGAGVSPWALGQE